MILFAALVGAAAMSVSSAQAAVRFGVSLPLPVVVTPAPVVYAAPTPIVYSGPVAPAPFVEVAPACPGVDYVWAPGYWAHHDGGYMWGRGGWNYRPHFDYGRQGYDRHDFDRHNHR